MSNKRDFEQKLENFKMEVVFADADLRSRSKGKSSPVLDAIQGLVTELNKVNASELGKRRIQMRVIAKQLHSNIKALPASRDRNVLMQLYRNQEFHDIARVATKKTETKKTVSDVLADIDPGNIRVVTEKDPIVSSTSLDIIKAQEAMNIASKLTERIKSKNDADKAITQENRSKIANKKRSEVADEEYVVDSHNQKNDPKGKEEETISITPELPELTDDNLIQKKTIYRAEVAYNDGDYEKARKHVDVAKRILSGVDNERELELINERIHNLERLIPLAIKEREQQAHKLKMEKHELKVEEYYRKVHEDKVNEVQLPSMDEPMTKLAVLVEKSKKAMEYRLANKDHAQQSGNNPKENEFEQMSYVLYGHIKSLGEITFKVIEDEAGSGEYDEEIVSERIRTEMYGIYDLVLEHANHTIDLAEKTDKIDPQTGKIDSEKCTANDKNLIIVARSVTSLETMPSKFELSESIKTTIQKAVALVDQVEPEANEARLNLIKLVMDYIRMTFGRTPKHREYKNRDEVGLEIKNRFSKKARNAESTTESEKLLDKSGMPNETETVGDKREHESGNSPVVFKRRRNNVSTSKSRFAQFSHVDDKEIRDTLNITEPSNNTEGLVK